MSTGTGDCPKSQRERGMRACACRARRHHPASIQRRVCRRRPVANYARTTISFRRSTVTGRPSPDTRRSGSQSPALVGSPVRGSGPNRQSSHRRRASLNPGRWARHISGHGVERSRASPSLHLEPRVCRCRCRTVSRETLREGGLKPMITHPARYGVRVQAKPLAGRSASMHARKRAKVALMRTRSERASHNLIGRGPRHTSPRPHPGLGLDLISASASDMFHVKHIPRLSTGLTASRGHADARIQPRRTP